MESHLMVSRRTVGVPVVGHHTSQKGWGPTIDAQSSVPPPREAGLQILHKS